MAGIRVNRLDTVLLIKTGCIFLNKARKPVLFLDEGNRFKETCSHHLNLRKVFSQRSLIHAARSCSTW